MVTRNVVLTETQDQLVQALVSSGRYQNAKRSPAGRPAVAGAGGSRVDADPAGVAPKVWHRRRPVTWLRAPEPMLSAGPLLAPEREPLFPADSSGRSQFG